MVDAANSLGWKMRVPNWLAFWYEERMSDETELKFPGADLARVRRRLQSHGARFLWRNFERNLVFDTAGRELRDAGVLLRLRQTDVALLTVKRPPKVPRPGFKVQEEIQTEVQDFESMRSILELLGYGVAFAYEKLREEWRLEGCTVCLDRLPFGDCVELEGEPEAMEGCAPLLGLDLDEGSDATYHQLHREHRMAAGLDEEESFVFPDRSAVQLPWE